MTLGTGTFYPGGRFAFPRSYIYGIWLSFNNTASVNWTDNRVTFSDSGGVVTGAIRFVPEFWSWSSNRYTMDYLIDESWYAIAPDPTEVPLPFALIYYIDPLNGRPYFVYQPFSTPGTGEFKHAAPPAPPGYWLPPWM